MINTIEYPTFETIAKSARFIKIQNNTEKPLPCESQSGFIYDKTYNEYFENWPVLNMSFMESEYFDKKLGVNCPRFACFNVNTNSIASGRSNTKFNPKLNRKVLIRKGFNIKDSRMSFMIPFCSVSVLCFIASFFPINFGPNVSSEQILVGSIMTGFSGFVLWHFNPPSNNEVKFDIEFKFKGSIPNNVRKIYHEYKQKFDSVYLICDAENRWDEQPAPPNPDPIMIGVKNINGNDVCFMLAKFDLTKNEDYITSEFIE